MIQKKLGVIEQSITAGNDNECLGVTVINTHLASLLIHWQSKTDDEPESFNTLLEEIRFLIEKRGFILAAHELLSLPRNEYPASPCSRCGYLTIGWVPTPEDLQERDMLSRHAAVLHRGTTVSGLMLCSECQDYLRNT
jgi:hypothetical protein